MENKSNTHFIVIIILIVVIAIAVFFSKKGKDNLYLNENLNYDNNVAVEEFAYKCGLTVNSPAVGDTVSFPLVLTGVVNNQASTDGCTWILFEGQGGMVSVGNGNAIYAQAPVMMQGDWMTTGPVNFSAVLAPNVGIPTGTPLTITFSEENPSGEGTSDTLSFQVIAQ